MAQAGKRGFARVYRLRRPAQFAAVAQAPSFRLSRRYLAIQMQFQQIPTESATGTVDRAAARRIRIGFTVSKRNAARAVDRARVKRVMREATRQTLPRLQQVLEERVAAGACHVVLRLKAPLPPVAQISLAALKKSLRREADALLHALLKRLQSSASAAPSTT